jgi:hypothetical protein
MVHRVPVFNIFNGRFGEKDVVWLGAAEGLHTARESMLRFAEDQPGEYFVFCSDSQLIVAAVDTSRLLKAKGAA